MKENLRTTKYADGTPISQGSSTSTTVAYWYYPNNNSGNKTKYGLYYNWKAAMGTYSSSSANPSGVQGVCPNGWHVPSAAEWDQMLSYVSSQSQYLCGSTSTYITKALASNEGWTSNSGSCVPGNNMSTNNSTGFSAMPAGGYYGSYNFFGTISLFWNCTEMDSEHASGRYIQYNHPEISYDNSWKYNAFAIRCVKN